MPSEKTPVHIREAVTDRKPRSNNMFRRTTANNRKMPVFQVVENRHAPIFYIKDLDNSGTAGNASGGSVEEPFGMGTSLSQ
jgi:hypothetical protein